MIALSILSELFCLMTAGAIDIVSHHTSDPVKLSDCYSHATPVGKGSSEIEKFCSYTDLVKCTEEGVVLTFGCCVTQEDNQSLFLIECPYFELKGHSILNDLHHPGFIRLPDNLSELNDYMCGPMNRKGLLCKDCIDGFGPSVTSLGYKCSNCMDAWYGIPLYLAVELIPITLFYLIILIFKIHLTSAPLVLFIFYSQVIMFEVALFRTEPVEKLVFEKEGSPLLRSVLFFYGIWNLDFIRYVLPPFCVSQNLQPFHIELLNYVSVVYPLFLIFLTWVCVQLHDNNFRPIVLFWKPFHRCFVRLQRGWDTRSDIIDVFASFFLLAYSKLLHQIILFTRCRHLRYIENTNSTPHYKLIMHIDIDIDCWSTKHLSFIIPSAILFAIFNLFPALLLILYPCRPFKRYLSECKLDSLFLTTFVEKFHGCYRDGLDGGRDMRSFSGLYFFLICLLYLHNAYVPMSLKLFPFTYASFIFIASALLIAFVKPYKQRYMNALDTLLLAQFTIVCILLSREYFRGDGTQIFAIMLIPAVVFKLLLFFNVCKKLKTVLIKWYTYCSKRDSVNVLEDSEEICVDDPQEKQPLINPTSTTVGMT